jgi:hypothetical protein
MDMNRTCLHCGKPIQAKRLTKKYCDDNCKQSAYFKRLSTQNENNNTDVSVTLNDVSKRQELPSDVAMISCPESSPTLQDIIIQDISAKISQLLALQNNTDCVIKMTDPNSPYKSIILLNFEK